MTSAAAGALGAPSGKRGLNVAIRRITEQITFDVSINVSDEQISGQATGHLLMADFDIEPPAITGTLQTEELVTVKIEFIAIAEKG